mmetsp:Transcript_29305/g.51298  ORF Transcript_29305/g.51298 Transcript_29305/m.51298 type:complete len:94 (+) Transcript_29305:469-750(+)
MILGSAVKQSSTKGHTTSLPSLMLGEMIAKIGMKRVRYMMRILRNGGIGFAKQNLLVKQDGDAKLLLQSASDDNQVVMDSHWKECVHRGLLGF